MGVDILRGHSITAGAIWGTLGYHTVTGATNPYTYTVLITDYTLGITDTNVRVCNVVLPAPATCAGFEFVIKDMGGEADIRPIHITVASGALIDAAAAYDVNNAYNEARFKSTGTGYTVQY